MAWYCIGFFERILKRILYLFCCDASHGPRYEEFECFGLGLILFDFVRAHPHSRHLMASFGLISTKHPQFPQMYLGARLTVLHCKSTLFALKIT